MKTLEQRLQKHTQKADGCWIWIGPRNSNGYGRIHWQGRKQYVHRLVYELAHGPLQKAIEVCHDCDNPACVRPDHLFPGAHKDNMADMVTKGRHPSQTQPETRPRGEQHYASKLTDADVRAIRSLYASGQSKASLARQFGIDRVMIRQIVARKAWRHID